MAVAHRLEETEAVTIAFRQTGGADHFRSPAPQRPAVRRKALPLDEHRVDRSAERLPLIAPEDQKAAGPITNHLRENQPTCRPDGFPEARPLPVARRVEKLAPQAVIAGELERFEADENASGGIGEQPRRALRLVREHLGRGDAIAGPPGGSRPVERLDEDLAVRSRVAPSKRHVGSLRRMCRDHRVCLVQREIGDRLTVAREEQRSIRPEPLHPHIAVGKGPDLPHHAISSAHERSDGLPELAVALRLAAAPEHDLPSCGDRGQEGLSAGQRLARPVHEALRAKDAHALAAVEGRRGLREPEALAALPRVLRDGHPGNGGEEKERREKQGETPKFAHEQSSADLHEFTSSSWTRTAALRRCSSV